MKTDYVSVSTLETETIAAEFAKDMQGGEVIAFRGGMGVGKTAFCRGFVEALGAGDVVSSPTFAIVNEYTGEQFTIAHFDMYRIETLDDLYSTGFFDYQDESTIILIEWSENIEAVLPPDVIYINLSRGDSENERSISIVCNQHNDC